MLQTLEEALAWNQLAYLHTDHGPSHEAKHLKGVEVNVFIQHLFYEHLTQSIHIMRYTNMECRSIKLKSKKIIYLLLPERNAQKLMTTKNAHDFETVKNAISVCIIYPALLLSFSKDH